LVRRSRRSVPETLGASSSMLGTALRVNYCETRCQKLNFRFAEFSEDEMRRPTPYTQYPWRVCNF
jgi:hypothetical protein